MTLEPLNVSVKQDFWLFLNERRRDWHKKPNIVKFSKICWKSLTLTFYGHSDCRRSSCEEKEREWGGGRRYSDGNAGECREPSSLSGQAVRVLPLQMVRRPLRLRWLCGSSDWTDWFTWGRGLVNLSTIKTKLNMSNCAKVLYSYLSVYITIDTYENNTEKSFRWRSVSFFSH